MASCAAAAARTVHRAVLPRRGTALAAGHRPCTLPARGLHRTRRVGGNPPPRPDRCRHDRSAAPRRAPRLGRTRSPHTRDACREPARRNVSDGRRRTGNSSTASRCAGGRPRAIASPSGDRSAATQRVLTPPSLVALLRTGWRPLVPLVHPTAAHPARRLIKPLTTPTCTISSKQRRATCRSSRPVSTKGRRLRHGVVHRSDSRRRAVAAPYRGTRQTLTGR